MNRNELIDVLTFIAAVDNRSVGETTITVWGDIIGDLSRDDALQAVRSHRRHLPGVWLEPGHVAEGVAGICRDRYERRTEQERAKYEAVCDSKAADTLREMAAELAHRKAIADNLLRYRRPPPNSPLRVGCPWCKASPGTRCTTLGTRQPLTKTRFHPSRVEALTSAPDRNLPTSGGSAVAVTDHTCICGREILDDHADACDHCTPVVDGIHPQPNGNSDTA